MESLIFTRTTRRLEKREGRRTGRHGGRGGRKAGKEGKAGVVYRYQRNKSQFTHKFYEIDASDKAA